MSIYIIKFSMTNGSVIELEKEAEDPGKISLSVTNNESNWYCMGQTLVNLNNVLSVGIEEKPEF